ncbi:LysR substrate-binding domain-containing protein [Pacificispira sp.]|uniref:LysR substrate-binding domain-containing protein n=1 Tax=Pacificispira sp. TaxID=2888761 RepID=UPI003BAB7EAB
MLNLSQVEAFVAVAEAGAFGAAASRLGLAQPTVSQQIGKLEETLGVTLFKRGRNNSPLTQHGFRLLPHARALLDSAKAFSKAARENCLRIGCSGNVASYIIAEDLKRFLDTEEPPAAWTIEAGQNPELGPKVARGILDIAVMEWAPADPGLQVRPWRTEALTLIAAGGSSLAKAGRIPPEELGTLDLIGGEAHSGTGTALRQALGRHADNLRVTCNLGSTEAVKDAVAAGLGASIVMERAVRSDLNSGRLAAIQIDGIRIEKPLYLAIPEEATSSTAARFADYLMATTVPADTGTSTPI